MNINPNQKPSTEYLDAIAEKLGRLNKADHGNSEPSNKPTHLPHDPDAVDILQWQGQAAIDYMKKKNQGGEI